MRDDESAGSPVAALAVRFEKQADVSRVVADVAAVAAGPRGRHHPQEMALAQDYVTRRLTETGWQVTRSPFESRWVIGVSDSGNRAPVLRRLRLFRRLTFLWAAVNALAAAATLTLLLTVPVGVFVGTATVSAWIITCSGVVLTVSESVRTARREGLHTAVAPRGRLHAYVAPIVSG
jgi:hypothetical protein